MNTNVRRAAQVATFLVFGGFASIGLGLTTGTAAAAPGAGQTQDTVSSRLQVPVDGRAKTEQTLAAELKQDAHAQSELVKHLKP